MIGRMQQRKQRRGMALLIVLASILILSAILSQMIYEATFVGTATRNTLERTQAMELAKGGVMLSMLRLKIDELISSIPGQPKADSLNEMHWAAPFIFPPPPEYVQAMLKKSIEQESQMKEALKSLEVQGTIYTQIEDERGKINLNGLPGFDALKNELKTLLTFRKEYRELFKNKRLDPSVLVDNIIDWIDTDDNRGATTQPESDALRELKVDYKMKNGRIQSLEELRLIPGFDDELIATFSPYFTVYVEGLNQRNININTAPSEVVNTIWKEGLDDYDSRLRTTKAFLAERAKQVFSESQGNGFKDLMQKMSIKPSDYYGNIQFDSDTFKITSQATVNSTTVSIEAIVQRHSTYAITYWRIY